jgi:hypothetical protein
MTASDIEEPQTAKTETRKASGPGRNKCRAECRVHCWAGEAKKQIVVTCESRGDAPHPRVLRFAAKSAETVETMELMFAPWKRVRKSVKRMNLNKKVSPLDGCGQGFPNWEEYTPPPLFL